MDKDRVSFLAPKSNVVQTMLVVLLIVSAFLIGSLTTKVSYLEKGGAGPNLAAAAPAAGNAAGQAAPAAEPTVGDVPKITERDYAKGNRKADIALIEYSDLECPFCKRFHPTMEQVVKEYGNKVQWVYRHFPLDFHVNAQKEAEASECAGELGGNDAFWKFVDAVNERTTSNGTGFALDKLVPLAKELGLPEAKFQQCLDGGKYTQYVKDSTAGGQRAGVSGTPGTIIMNLKSGKSKLIPGALPYEQVKPMIDEIMQG